MPKIKDEVGVKTPTKAPDDGYGSMRKASQSNKSSLSKVLMKRRGPGFGKKPAAEDEGRRKSAAGLLSSSSSSSSSANRQKHTSPPAHEQNKRGDVVVLPPKHSVSLPWCLVDVMKEEEEGATERAKAPQGATAPIRYPGNVTDFIITNIFAEYRSCVGEIITQILSSEANFALLDILQSSNAYQQLVRSIVHLATKFNTFFLRALLNWREYSLQRSKEQTQKALPESLKPTISQMALYEERFIHTVEYVFCTIVTMIAEGWSSSKDIEEEISKELTKIAFEHFRSEKKTFNDNPSWNEFARKRIPNLYANLLGGISKHRLGDISEHLAANVQTPTSSSSRTKVLAKLEALSYVKLYVRSPVQMDRTVAFLSMYKNLMKTAKAKDVKLAFGDRLANMLSMIINDVLSPESATLGEFARLLEWFYQYEQSDRKKRMRDTWIRLRTTVVCVAPKDMFMANAFTWMKTLGKSLKDTKLRALSLESLELILQKYCRTFAQTDDSFTMRMNEIFTMIFPTKRLILSPAEPLDVFVQIIVAVAKRDLDYCFRKIIFEFLRSFGQKSDNYISRCIIALRAIILLHDQSQSLASSEGESSLEPYMQSICDHISQLISTLDNQFGHLLLINQTKPLLEIVAKEKSLVVLRLCVSFIPATIPSNVGTFELQRALCRYVIHIDKELREKAANTLHVLMDTSARHRAPIVREFANFLCTLPDKHDQVIVGAMAKLKQFLSLWHYHIQQQQTTLHSSSSYTERPASSSPEKGMAQSQSSAGDPIDAEMANLLTLVEGVCVGFLSSPNVRLRSYTFDILRAVRAVERANCPKELLLELPTRLMDICEESGTSFLRRLRLDQHFQYHFGEGLLDFADCTFEKILRTAESPNDCNWTYLLSCFSTLAAELCPQVMLLAWQAISARLTVVQLEERPSAAEHLYLNSLWRNYVVLCCSAATDYVSNAVLRIKDKSKASKENLASGVDEDTIGTRNIFLDYVQKSKIMTRQHFFSYLAIELRTEVRREAVVMAMRGTHNDALDDLFQFLRPLELDVTAKRAKSKKAERLRIDLSTITSAVASNLPVYEVRQKGSHLLSCAQESLSCLQRPESDIIDMIPARYNFCMLISSLAEAMFHAGMEPFELSLRRQAFQLLKTWVAIPPQNQMTMNLAAAVKTLNYLRSTRKVTESAEHTFLAMNAAHAIAHLGIGPIWETQFTSKLFYLQWVVVLLKSDHKFFRDEAQLGLEYFLKSNFKSEECCEIALDSCFSSELAVADGFFKGIVELFRWGKSFPSCPISTLFNLLLFKLSRGLLDMRRSAVQLLRILVARDDQESYWANAYDPPSFDSSLMEVFRVVVNQLSGLLADDFPAIALQLLNELVYRLDMTNEMNQKSMLSYAIPWIRKLRLDVLEIEDSQAILTNFFWVTFTYNARHGPEVFCIWETLTETAENVPVIVDFTLSQGVKQKNPEFVALGKRVLLFVAQTALTLTVETLVAELSTVSAGVVMRKQTHRITPDQSHGSLSSEPHGVTKERKSLTPLFPPVEGFVSPARGHWALVLLAEMSFEFTDEISRHLPVVLQQVFLGLDSSNKLVFRHCRMLILNTIRMMIIEPINSEKGGLNISEEARAQAIDLQAYLSVAVHSQASVSAWNSHEMEVFVHRVVNLLTDKSSTLKEQWASETLSWAFSCPSLHLRCRSFQIYRGLNCPPTSETITDLLSCLLRCKSNPTPENCVITLEILNTLEVLVDRMDTGRLVLFNQMFWAAVAMLHSDFEEEFLRTVHLLSKITDRVNFNDKAVQDVFLASRPKEWDPPFIGIQPLVLKGLLSSVTDTDSFQLMSKMTTLPLDEIFQPDCTLRLVINILAVVPYVLSILSKTPDSNSAFCALEDLSLVCEKLDRTPLSDVFAQALLPNGIIQDPAAFLERFVSAFTSSFFPKYAMLSFTFLLEMLTKGPPAHHASFLRTLGLLLKVVDLGTEPYDSHIPYWFSTLCFFVGTRSWREALECLDNVAQPSSLTQTKVDMSCITLLRMLRTGPVFPNIPSLGTQQTAMALDHIISGGETKSEYIINAAFFSKFFSSDDLVDQDDDEIQSVSPRHGHRSNDSATEMGEDFDAETSNDASSMDGFATSASSAGVGWFNQAPAFPSSFPSFKGFDEIMTDISQFGSEMSYEGPSFGDMDSSGISTPRPRGMISNPRLQFANEKWSAASAKMEFSDVSELFLIFLVATDLLGLLLEDYEDLYNETIMKIYNEKLVHSVQQPILRVEKVSSAIQQATQPPLDSDRLADCYRQRAETDEAFEKEFMSSRLRHAADFNNKHQNYLSVKQDINTPIQNLRKCKKARRDAAEAAVCIALLNIHHALLQALEEYQRMRRLAENVIQSSSKTKPSSSPADVADINEMMKVNREAVDAIRLA